MDEILEHYNAGTERDRLGAGKGLLERERTLEILDRFLPRPPATIFDVGGGPGTYAFPLAEQGYQVHLIDVTPLHVEQVRQRMQAGIPRPLCEASVGDARRLHHGDLSADGYLLLGPLYHLTDRADRIAALCEAHRILKPGGAVVAAGITRFASLLDGLAQNFIEDPAFLEILLNDMATGQHRNPSGSPNYFTTAYFHQPQELCAEVNEAGFRDVTILAVQGPGWLRKDFDRHWQDPREREKLLKLIRAVESEPALLAVSPHVLVAAIKP